MNKLILIVCTAILLLAGTNTYFLMTSLPPKELSVQSDIERIEDFFINSEPSNLIKVEVTKDKSFAKKIESAEIGSVIRVTAIYKSSKPKGNIVFFFYPESGGYEDAKISKGRSVGQGEIRKGEYNGRYTTFHLPRVGQIAGKAKIYAYIPGHGVGVTELQIAWKSENT